jgi:hypothetical protein
MIEKEAPLSGGTTTTQPKEGCKQSIKVFPILALKKRSRESTLNKAEDKFFEGSFEMRVGKTQINWKLRHRSLVNIYSAHAQTWLKDLKPDFKNPLNFKSRFDPWIIVDRYLKVHEPRLFARAYFDGLTEDELELAFLKSCIHKELARVLMSGTENIDNLINLICELSRLSKRAERKKISSWRKSEKQSAEDVRALVKKEEGLC